MNSVSISNPYLVFRIPIVAVADCIPFQFLIEAMKMEIKISSPCNGVCVDISVEVGDILDADSRMALISPS